MPFERIPEFVPCISAIGEDMAEPREAEAYGLEYIGRAVTVLNVGSVDEDEQQEAAGVGTICRLRPLTFLPAS